MSCTIAFLSRHEGARRDYGFRVRTISRIGLDITADSCASNTCEQPAPIGRQPQGERRGNLPARSHGHQGSALDKLETDLFGLARNQLGLLSAVDRNGNLPVTWWLQNSDIEP